MNHYDTIEQAILYLTAHATTQPSLDEVAKHVGLSPFHFQRLFQEWAGVSPKKFLQYISLEHAKALLQQNRPLLQTSYEVGLSGPSRLHDLFVTIEGMTPGEFKQRGQSLVIHYSFAPSRFGRMLLASTERGLCYLAFCTNDTEGLVDLRRRFPAAVLIEKSDGCHEQAQAVVATGRLAQDFKLHLSGTPFQLKVWQALLQLPPGAVGTYSDIARHVQHPRASRAVGTAIGSNPVAYIIPCHRVIQSTGIIGGYRWGPVRKRAMLGWEASRLESTKAV